MKEIKLDNKNKLHDCIEGLQKLVQLQVYGDVIANRIILNDAIQILTNLSNVTKISTLDKAVEFDSFNNELKVLLDMYLSKGIRVTGFGNIKPNSDELKTNILLSLTPNALHTLDSGFYLMPEDYSNGFNVDGSNALQLLLINDSYIFVITNISGEYPAVINVFKILVNLQDGGFYYVPLSQQVLMLTAFNDLKETFQKLNSGGDYYEKHV